MTLLRHDTPIEVYHHDGVPIHVKREDLCWPFPRLSKARGVYAAIEKRPGVNVAVVDTGRSLNGQLVATIGLTFGRQVMCGYPRYVADPEAVPGPALALQSLGVQLVPLAANRQFVMRAEMKKVVPADWYLFPTGLRLEETVDATDVQMSEVLATMDVGTVIVPTGTGTHLAGILRAVEDRPDIEVIGVQGYRREVQRFVRDVYRASGVGYRKNMHIVTSVCDYYEVRADKLPPFPAHLHYEVRAWKWLTTSNNVHNLKKPIVFWNIGD